MVSLCSYDETFRIFFHKTVLQVGAEGKAYFCLKFKRATERGRKKGNYTRKKEQKMQKREKTKLSSSFLPPPPRPGGIVLFSPQNLIPFFPPKKKKEMQRTFTYVYGNSEEENTWMMYDNDTEGNSRDESSSPEMLCMYTHIVSAINALLKLHLFSPSFEGKASKSWFTAPGVE